LSLSTVFRIGENIEAFGLGEGVSQLTLTV